MTLHHKSLLVLLSIPLLWGLTFPLIKMASFYMNAESFIASRCVLALLALLPFVLLRLFILSKQQVFHGLILGVLNGANIACQTVGLKTLDPASSAFISGMGVVFVPFLAPLFGLKKPTRLNYFCSFLCLLGLYILTGAHLAQNVVGVSWTLGCALFYALFVVYLQKAKPSNEEVLVFAFYQILGAALLGIVLSVHLGFHLVVNGVTASALIFCGVITTTLVIILQTQYQRYVPATQVILIYALEALFASLFSYFLVREHFSLRFILGGIVMIGSILLNELRPKILLHLCSNS